MLYSIQTTHGHKMNWEKNLQMFGESKEILNHQLIPKRNFRATAHMYLAMSMGML